jgi:hypothetical protein
VYSGTLLAFGTTYTSYANGAGIGAGAWIPTGTASESRTYQFTYTVSAAAPDSTQGGTAAIGFTWETQNT